MQIVPLNKHSLMAASASAAILAAALVTDATLSDDRPAYARRDTQRKLDNLLATLKGE